jgi:hypothetical protein
MARFYCKEPDSTEVAHRATFRRTQGLNPTVPPT